MNDRVLVVGDVVDDIVVRPHGAITTGSDTDAQIEHRPGGSAANTAAWLGRLGRPVTLLARVSLDRAAHHRAALRMHGVDAHLIEDTRRRAAAIVVIVEDGERTMFVERGANTGLVSADIPASVWRDVSLLHLTGYSFFDPQVRSVALSLVSEADTRGVAWSLDPSSLAYLRRVGTQAFLGWTTGADVAFPNLAEAALLSGEHEPGSMARALTEAYETVVVTCGVDGAVAATRSGETAQAVAPPRGTVVDTTGAGDAFSAGFLAARLSGAGLGECLTAGCAAGAQVVCGAGGRPH